MVTTDEYELVSSSLSYSTKSQSVFDEHARDISIMYDRCATILPFAFYPWVVYASWNLTTGDTLVRKSCTMPYYGIRSSCPKTTTWSDIFFVNAFQPLRYFGGATKVDNFRKHSINPFSHVSVENDYFQFEKYIFSSCKTPHKSSNKDVWLLINLYNFWSKTLWFFFRFDHIVSLPATI